MRNLSVEYMRVLFMSLIVLLHLMQYGYGESEIIESTSVDSYFQLCFIILGKLGVPGFVFITGYYGLKLSCNKISTLWVQTSFYALLSALLMMFFFDKPISKTILLSLLPMADNYWFIEDYIILMLFSPFINLGLSKVSKRQFQFLVISIIIIIYCIYWVKVRYSAMSLLLFFSLYVIGRYLSLYPIRLLYQYKEIVLFLSLFFYISLPLSFHYQGWNHLISKYFVTYYNFFTLSIVVSLFFILNEVKWIGKGNILTKNVLAVYLIHCSKYGQKVLNECIASNVSFDVFSVITIIVIVYITSCLIDEVRKIICNPIEKRIAIQLSRLIERK